MPESSSPILTAEERYRFLSESATDYAFITLSADNRITSWSKGAEIILGYREADAIGEPGSIFFTEEDRANGAVDNELSTAARDGRAADERWHRRQDGSRFWASGVLSAIRGDDGTLLGFTKVMRDLTERRKAQEQRDRFFVLSRDLLAISNMGEPRWVRVSPSFSRVLGWSEAEVLGATFWDRIHPDDLERAQDGIAGLGQGKRSTEIEHRLLSKTGQYRWISWVAAAYPEEKLLYWAGRDVTERREYEISLARNFASQGRELDRTKEELHTLAAGLMTALEDERRRIARELHDSVSQQLALIEMQLFAIGETLDEQPEAVGERLGRLYSQAGALATEVREISHRLHPSILEHVGVAAALRGLAEEFITAHKLNIQSELKEVPNSLSIEARTALYRIAQELLRNVVRHAGDGVTVMMTLSYQGGAVELLVKDDGDGFDFAKMRGKGGLGIISMQERAASVGGQLTIESQPGDGTVVRVKVPAHSGAEVAAF